MVSASERKSVRLTARRIVAAFATAALSIVGSLILWYGLPGGEQYANLTDLIVAMGLVAMATVIGTLWSGQAIGLLLGAPPLIVAYSNAVLREADPQGGIAIVIITFSAVAVSAASWGLTLAVTRGDVKGWLTRRT